MTGGAGVHISQPVVLCVMENLIKLTIERSLKVNRVSHAIVAKITCPINTSYK
jgi:hypothetical protein